VSGPMRLPYRWWDVALLVGGMLLVVTEALGLAAVWHHLPPLIPTQFSADGRPEQWGSRQTLLIFPAVSAGAVLAGGLLSRIPHLLNYPVQVTATNRVTVWSWGRALVESVCAVFVPAVLGWLEAAMIRAGVAHTPLLTGALTVVVVAGPAPLIVLAIVAMRRATRGTP